MKKSFLFLSLLAALFITGCSQNIATTGSVKIKLPDGNHSILKNETNTSISDSKNVPDLFYVITLHKSVNMDKVDVENISDSEIEKKRESENNSFKYAFGYSGNTVQINDLELGEWSIWCAAYQAKYGELLEDLYEEFGNDFLNTAWELVNFIPSDNTEFVQDNGDETYSQNDIDYYDSERADQFKALYEKYQNLDLSGLVDPVYYLENGEEVVTTIKAGNNNVKLNLKLCKANLSMKMLDEDGNSLAGKDLVYSVILEQLEDVYGNKVYDNVLILAPDSNFPTAAYLAPGKWLINAAAYDKDTKEYLDSLYENNPEALINIMESFKSENTENKDSDIMENYENQFVNLQDTFTQEPIETQEIKPCYVVTGMTADLIAGNNEVDVKLAAYIETYTYKIAGYDAVYDEAQENYVLCGDWESAKKLPIHKFQITSVNNYGKEVETSWVEINLNEDTAEEKAKEYEIDLDKIVCVYSDYDKYNSNEYPVCFGYVPYLFGYDDITVCPTDEFVTIQIPTKINIEADGQLGINLTSNGNQIDEDNPLNCFLNDEITINASIENSSVKIENDYKFYSKGDTTGTAGKLIQLEDVSVEYRFTKQADYTSTSDYKISTNEVSFIDFTCSCKITQDSIKTAKLDNTDSVGDFIESITDKKTVQINIQEAGVDHYQVCAYKAELDDTTELSYAKDILIEEYDIKKAVKHYVQLQPVYEDGKTGDVITDREGFDKDGWYEVTQENSKYDAYDVGLDSVICSLDDSLQKSEIPFFGHVPYSFSYNYVDTGTVYIPTKYTETITPEVSIYLCDGEYEPIDNVYYGDTVYLKSEITDSTGEYIYYNKGGSTIYVTLEPVYSYDWLDGQTDSLICYKNVKGDISNELKLTGISSVNAYESSSQGNNKIEIDEYITLELGEKTKEASISAPVIQPDNYIIVNYKAEYDGKTELDGFDFDSTKLIKAAKHFVQIKPYFKEAKKIGEIITGGDFDEDGWYEVTQEESEKDFYGVGLDLIEYDLPKKVQETEKQYFGIVPYEFTCFVNDEPVGESSVVTIPTKYTGIINNTALQIYVYNENFMPYEGDEYGVYSVSSGDYVTISAYVSNKYDSGYIYYYKDEYDNTISKTVSILSKTSYSWEKDKETLIDNMNYCIEKASSSDSGEYKVTVTPSTEISFVYDDENQALNADFVSDYFSFALEDENYATISTTVTISVSEILDVSVKNLTAVNDNFIMAINAKPEDYKLEFVVYSSSDTEYTYIWEVEWEDSALPDKDSKEFEEISEELKKLIESEGNKCTVDIFEYTPVCIKCYAVLNGQIVSEITCDASYEM